MLILSGKIRANAKAESIRVEVPGTWESKVLTMLVLTSMEVSSKLLTRLRLNVSPYGRVLYLTETAK